MVNIAVAVCCAVLLLVKGCFSQNDQPTALRLDVLSSDTIRVVWEFPMDLNLQFDNFRLNVSGGAKRSRLVGMDGRVLVKHLTPSTTYRMTLETKYTGTEKYSQPAEATATTFARGTDMPRELTATALSANSIKVTWKAPTSVNPDTKYYFLKVGKKHFEIRYRDFTGEYTVDDLKANRQYNVAVRVGYKSPDYKAPAAETTVKTQSSWACHPMSAQYCAARLEEARLRSRLPRSAASGLLRSQQVEHSQLEVAEWRQRGTADQRQTRLRAQHSRSLMLL
nr:unnamed protein product [Spirometra erinaceieuropaei]